jgi:hypothetical protein
MNTQRTEDQNVYRADDERGDRNASRGELITALEGLDFPASKDGIVRKAKDKGGIDTEVPHVLEQIEDRTYEDTTDLLGEVERIYALGGGLTSGGPAAPA